MGNGCACLRDAEELERSRYRRRILNKPNLFSEDFNSLSTPLRVLKYLFHAPVDHKLPTNTRWGTNSAVVSSGLLTSLLIELHARPSLVNRFRKKEHLTAVDIEDVRREVSVMLALPDHHNIVRLRAAYEDDEAVHLVMELCEGGELFDRIVARGHYTERAAASVLRTVAEVVRVCHDNGVMHRDLKPENFLYANKKDNSPLKVIDFDLSVFFHREERFSEIVGSPYYMAPEVLKRNYGPEIDIWSAGVILYILFCGLPPFWAENPWLTNAKRANVPLGDLVRARLRQFSVMNRFKKKALRVISEHLSTEEVEIVRDMFKIMAKDDDGKVTFEELKEGLKKVGSQLGEPEIKLMMEAADVNGNGVLDYGEFVAVIIHLQRMENDEHLRRAFWFFDKDGSDYIEIDELREALSYGSCHTNEEVLTDIMREVDTNKDGRISYEEFATMMKTGTDWRKASCSKERDLRV